MDVVTYRRELPPLRGPILVAAFEGWNDAGESASLAVDTIRKATAASPVADLDAEAFFDFQQTRPMVRSDADGQRVIDWPELTLSAAPLAGARGDLLLLTGAEPNLRWRTFCDAVVDVARRLDVRLVITVGALQVDVPHTRPVPITLTSASPQLADELDLRPSTYEGPTGITGVLHATASAAGLPAVSMWAGVPHYLASAGYLRGALALAERLAGLVDADFDLHRLARDAAAQSDEIAELIAHDDELEEYVEELELRAAAEPVEGPGGNLPDAAVSGDEIAAELERYLRGER